MNRPIVGSLAALILATAACSTFAQEAPQPTSDTGALVGPDHTISTFAVPSPDPGPWFTAEGSDGNVWFTDLKKHVIGRITTAGTITEFKLMSGVKEFGITPGTPGTLWFADDTKIGKITTSGSVTEFTLPSPDCAQAELAYGPDGNVWFTDDCTNSIGVLSAGGGVTEYRVPTNDALPFGITGGPDGNLWFTEAVGDKIGRITTLGQLTEFSIPSHIGGGGIIAASDGNLYAVANSFSTTRLERITPTGAITEFRLRDGAAGYPAEDRRGRIWISYANGEFGTFDIVTHAVSPLIVAPAARRVNDLVLGADGDIWFAAFRGYVGVIE